MIVRLIAGGAAAVVVLTACAPKPSLDLAAAPKGAYELDPGHKSLVWRVAHANGLSMYVARFDDFHAALDFDPAAPETARIEVVIDPLSVSTGDKAFDADIANGAGLLAAKTHPQITFRSTKVEVTGERTARVTGDVGFRGVVRPLTLEVTFNGAARDPIRGNKQILGFSASGALDRSAFGADDFVNFGVSDRVELQIEAEFIKQ